MSSTERRARSPQSVFEEVEGLVDEHVRVALGVARDPDVARGAGCAPGCSRDDARLEVGRGIGSVVGRRCFRDYVLEFRVQISAAGVGGGYGGDQSRSCQEARRVGYGFADSLVHGTPERVDDGLVGCAGGEGVADEPDLLRVIGEQHVDLRREVAEERTGRHLGACRDLVHCRGAPPFLIVHGALDTLVLRDEASAFADQLRAVSRQPVVYAELPGTQHNFDFFHSLRSHAVADAVVRFTQLTTTHDAADVRMSTAMPPAANHAEAGKDRVMPRPDTKPVDALDVLVFIVELMLLALLAVAGARLASHGTAIMLAVVLPLVTAVAWALYLAPHASRRLPRPSRLVAKLALMLAASASLAAASALAWGLAFLLAGSTLVTVGELREAAADRSGPRRTATDPGGP
jgi:hypothetical protein